MINLTTAQREHLLHGGTVGVRVRVSPVIGDPFNITGVNIVDRSMTVDSKCAPRNDLVIGYAEAAELLFSLVLDDTYSAVAWEGARLTVYLNIAGSEVQVGIYTVDEPTRWRGTIAQIRALDNMARFNREFEPAHVSGTDTATILSQICTRVNVAYVNENVANVTVDRTKLEGLTYTQIVGYIAGLSGCNALCDEQGRLVFKLPTATGLEYPARIVTHEEYADAPVTVTGVRFVQDAKTEYTESGSVEIPAVNVLVGTDEYVLDVSDNVLIAGLTESQIEARLQAIYNVWNTVSYYPARSLSVTGLPHLQPMDTVTFGDRLTLVTGHNYAVNSTSVIRSAGEPETVKGYATGYEFTAEQRQIIAGIAARRAGYVEQVVTDAYEAAALALHEEIVNALGFWQTEVENPDGSKTVYTHDKPALAESMYIECKPGPGQFAWTTTGWNGGSPTWQYGVTRDGNMILKALSVHKLTADMITLTDGTTNVEQAIEDIELTPGPQGEAGVGISSSTVTYAGSTSGTTAPSSGWSSNIPAVAPGNYLWTRTVLTLTNSTTQTSYSVAHIGKDGNTGADGIPGAKGDPGVPGAAGRGIVSIVEEYAIHTSPTTAPASGWTTTRPAFDIETDLEKYLWVRLKTTYDSAPITVYSTALVDLAWGLRERVAEGADQVATLGDSLDSIANTLGQIDTEQRITVLDRLALQAEYDRIRVENKHLALILADVDDSMFDGYAGAISEYNTAATAVLEWLAYATDAPNFSDVDTSEWSDLQTDYLLSLDRVNQLAQAVETQHRAELTSQMLSFEQIQGQFQERLKIDAQGMTINVDDENALTIRNDGMRIFVEGVERAEFTSSGFSANQGRVDVLQVGAHIVSRDGDITVWRPI